ncbi:MAG: cytochrome c biogenesis protein ResB [Phycisphaerae bacterium]
MLTHISILLVLAGALVTKIFAVDGQLSIVEGQTLEHYTIGQNTMPLGFAVTLNRFTVGFYPGGDFPRSFESQITILEPATGGNQSRIISMNHPTEYKGYTFYQSSYSQEDGQNTSVLSVSCDPGQPIVFTGYVTMLAGMLVILAARAMKRKNNT